MASLYSRGNGYYYLSFFRAARTPSRKQLSTGARTKREAVRVQRRLEEAFDSGAFDPWRDDPRAFLRGGPSRGGPDTTGPETLGAAVAAFLGSKSNLSPPRGSGTARTSKRWRPGSGRARRCGTSRARRSSATSTAGT